MRETQLKRGLSVRCSPLWSQLTSRCAPSITRLQEGATVREVSIQSDLLQITTYSFTLFRTEPACLIVRCLAQVRDSMASAPSGRGDKRLLRLQRVTERPMGAGLRRNFVVLDRKVINEIMVDHREDEVGWLIARLLDVAGSMLLRPARQSPRDLHR